MSIEESTQFSVGIRVGERLGPGTAFPFLISLYIVDFSTHNHLSKSGTGARQMIMGERKGPILRGDKIG